MANRNHTFVVRPFQENGRSFIAVTVSAKRADIDRNFTMTVADVEYFQSELRNALLEVYRWTRS